MIDFENAIFDIQNFYFMLKEAVASEKPVTFMPLPKDVETFGMALEAMQEKSMREDDKR